METDREMLIWIHERLRLVNGDDELLDFMHRLRAIILATKPRARHRAGVCHDMTALYAQIKNKSLLEKVWESQLKNERV